MGSFYQNGIVANLHDFSYGSSSENNYKKLENELVHFSKDNPMELILPSLFSEINGSALPNIVNEINKTKFLNHVVVGLDKSNSQESKTAFKFFDQLKIPFSILSILISRKVYIEHIAFADASCFSLRSMNYVL